MREILNELPVVALDALLRKREQIADKIKELERQAAGLRSDLMHIDHTLRVIDPSYSPGKKAPRLRFSTVGYFEHGELSRRIYEALRLSPTITASEVAEAAMAAKKLNDSRVRSYFVTRFLSRLAQMAKEGQLVRIREADGFSLSWKLADSP